jgi:thiamine transporter
MSLFLRPYCLSGNAEFLFLGGIFMTETKKTSHYYVRMLCEGAIMVALAQVLSYLKVWELPQGGSVTLAMVPIFLFASRWGMKNGASLIAAFVFSLLQLIFDGAYAYSWQSMLGDYIIAFTALGLAGFFKNMKGGVFIGTVVGSVARFLCHYVTGATVWAEYMPEKFFGMTMTTPWFYSALYNGSFMAIDMVLCLVIFAILYKPMGKYIRGEDIK